KTLSTGPSVDSGSPPVDLGFAEASAQEQEGPDTAVAKRGDDVDGLANARAKAPDPADEGVDAGREKTDELADATAEPPGQVAGGFNKTPTETPAQPDQNLDPPTTERTGGGTDLTDGNKVQPGQSPSTNPTARKTPLRDTFNKARSDINEAVTGLSS